MAKEQDKMLLITLLVLLIMGDSRAYYFSHYKNLRIVCILLLSIYTMVLMFRGKIKFRPLILGVVPFFLVALLGGLRSPSIGVSLSKMISYFLLIFLTLHFFPYLIRKTNGKVLMDISYLSALVMILGLIGMIFYPNLVFLIGRYRGMLGNPNGLGIYSTLTFPLALCLIGLFPHKKSSLRIIMFLIVFSVILSGSRTALGTIGIFYALYIFYKGGRTQVFALWSFILPTTYLFIQSISIERLVQMVGLGEFLRVESLTTGTGRFLAWSMGLAEINRNPFIGKGFAYEEIFFHELEDILIATEHQGGMHNSFLTFIMNNGYIGFTFFLVFLLIMLFRVRARAFGMPFIIASLISATFESWLNSSLNAFTIHFFLVLTLLIEYPRIKAQLNPT
ncbi:MAG: O-antigen ligase family protein [Bacteroidota bacterium]